MNKTIQQANAMLQRGDISSEMMQRLMAQPATNSGRTVIDPSRLDAGRAMELSRLLHTDNNGELTELIRPLPYDEIKDDTEATLNVVMQAEGLYTFPTQELVDWLHGEIDDDPELEPHETIEICAGTGWLGRSLGITSTDSRLQERPDIREYYLSKGCQPIRYPDDVAQMDALTAIRKFQPEYVIASYCTHLYGTGSLKSGNAMGVDTRWVIQHCRRFYHIGNDAVHSRDPIMKRPHQRLQFDWLVTRGNSDKARIYIWENKIW